MKKEKMNTQGRTPRRRENLSEAPKDFKEKSLQVATRKTKFSEILESGGQEAAEILFKAGLHCVGCPMTAQESLEDGCMAHGMGDKDIDKLVEELNNGGEK